MIELPKFDIFNKEEVATFPEIKSPEVVTTSEIKKTYAELGYINIKDGEGNITSTPNQWNHGVQESLPDNTIVSRSFYELEFDQDAIDFQFIAEGNNIEYGTEKYWRVIHRFTEIVYESDNSKELENFKIWQESRNKWQQEIIYDHVEIDPIVWEREKIEVPVIAGDITLGTVATCPTDTPIAPIGQTGNSIAISEGGENLSCFRWKSLPIAFNIIFDVGNALGGFIETDGVISSIKIKEIGNIDNNGIVISNGSFENPIKFSNRYIQVTFNTPTRTLPTFVKLKRYGRETFRFQLPFEIDQDPEVLIHPNNIINEQRLFPPVEGKIWPDDFWNQGIQTPISNFASRIISSGGSLTNE